MVNVNGIPTAPNYSKLAQKVEDLKREVERLTSAPTYVTIGNIVEGGTISKEAGSQLTETVQKEIVIERQNLAEAALTDVVVTGSISSRGKTAENPPRDIDVRLTTVARSMFGQGAVPNPAVVFVTENVEEADYALAPGFYSPDGRSLNLRTAGEVEGGGLGFIDMSPEKITVTSMDIKVGPVLGGGKVTIGTLGNLAGGPTDVRLMGSVTVNGSPLSDSGWLSATYQNGWMDYGNGFGGLQYRKLNNVLYLRGSIKGGAVNSVVATLPTGFRPMVPSGTSAMEFPITARQGTTWYSGTMYAYTSGELRYDAPPGVWSGADRCVINAAFPL